MNVHIYPTPITHESRIERLTQALAEAGVFDRILIVGTQPGGLPEIQELDKVRSIRRVPRVAETGSTFIAKILKTRSWTERVYAVLADETISCVTCHSLAVLPLSVRLARRHGAKLVYEPHELETETANSRGVRKFLMRRLERRLICSVNLTIVVSGEIARWYEVRYGLPRVEVVRNVPSPTGDPGVVDLRGKFGLASSDLLFVYSGGLFHGRRVKQYLRIFTELPPDRHILFMGSGPLAGLVEDAVRRHPNIHFLPSVPPRLVLAHLRSADAGLSGVENLCLSYYFSLPNKQFEYLHSGLGSIVPDFPEMSRLISTTGAGWVVGEDTDAAWRHTLGALRPEDIENGKAKAREAAREYTLERETAQLVRAYRELAPFTK
jgi:glycosyltransferase involved in cell wall biosynthesis